MALVFGVAFCFACFAELYWGIASHIWRKRVFWLVLSVCYAVMGVYSITAPFKQRVILDPDFIEVIGLFGVRRIAQQDVGARMGVAAYWPTWVILSKVYGQPKIMFEMCYDFDKVFWDWFNAIPIADGTFFKTRKEQRRSKSKSIT